MSVMKNWPRWKVNAKLQFSDILKPISSDVFADIAAVIGSVESYIVSVLNGISGAFDTLYNGLLSGIVQLLTILTVFPVR